MITYLAMNIMFPGPFFIYAIGFGWVVYIVTLPLDLILGGILSGLSGAIKGPSAEAKGRVALSIFSVSLNFAFVGVIMAIIGIIWFFRDFKYVRDDFPSKVYSIIGFVLSVVSVVMTIVFTVIMTISFIGLGVVSN